MVGRRKGLGVLVFDLVAKWSLGFFSLLSFLDPSCGDSSDFFEVEGRDGYCSGHGRYDIDEHSG